MTKELIDFQSKMLVALNEAFPDGIIIKKNTTHCILFEVWQEEKGYQRAFSHEIYKVVDIHAFIQMTVDEFKFKLGEALLDQDVPHAPTPPPGRILESPVKPRSLDENLFLLALKSDTIDYDTRS